MAACRTRIIRCKKHPRAKCNDKRARQSEKKYPGISLSSAAAVGGRDQVKQGAGWGVSSRPPHRDCQRREPAATTTTNIACQNSVFVGCGKKNKCFALQRIVLLYTLEIRGIESSSSSSHFRPFASFNAIPDRSGREPFANVDSTSPFSGRGGGKGREAITIFSLLSFRTCSGLTIVLYLVVGRGDSIEYY